jgi:hypothetical protein
VAVGARLRRALRRARLPFALLIGLLALDSSLGAQRHPAQRIPETADFPSGPAIGERLPDFVLPNQRGEKIDFHADRAGHKAAVLFQRSAVW